MWQAGPLEWHVRTQDRQYPSRFRASATQWCGAATSPCPWRNYADSCNGISELEHDAVHHPLCQPSSKQHIATSPPATSCTLFEHNAYQIMCAGVYSGSSREYSLEGEGSDCSRTFRTCSGVASIMYRVFPGIATGVASCFDEDAWPTLAQQS